MIDPLPKDPNDIVVYTSVFTAIVDYLERKFKEFRVKRPKGSLFLKGAFLTTSRDFVKTFFPFIVIASISVIMFLLPNTEETKNSEPLSSSNGIQSIADDLTPITSWPIKRSAKDSWLDELDPILDEEGAFFIGKWDVFDKIKVEDTIYPHSVGICIPLEYQWKYINLHNPEQIPHNEIIEYTLGYEYKTFQFDYGIDDSSFPDGIKKAPRCEFRIIVQACNSKDYVQSKDEPLFDTGWRNYRCCAHRSTEMDVSGCEAMRITVRWRFNVQQNGPIAFQIAIFNPILRAAKYKDNPTQSPIPLE